MLAIAAYQSTWILPDLPLSPASRLLQNQANASLLRRLRPQSPTKHIQHITAIAQRNRAEQGKVTEDERLALNRTAHGQVSQHLGEGHEAVFGMGDWFYVRWIGIKFGHFSNISGVFI